MKEWMVSLMDLASIIGIVLGAVMVVFGILWGNGVSALQNFVDVPSIIITLGGSLAGLIASNTLKDFLNNFKGMFCGDFNYKQSADRKYCKRLNYLP